MHKACLINPDEKYHCSDDTNSTRTAVGCRHNMTKINRDIRTTNRLHVNQRTWARLVVYPAASAWTPVLERTPSDHRCACAIQRMPPVVRLFTARPPSK